MKHGLPTASVVRSSQATPARRRGQPCSAAIRSAAYPLISPADRVQTSGATSTLESERRGFSALGTACGPDLAESLDRALTEAETVASVRLQQARTPAMSAAAVRKPMDHADLYAQRRHFQRIRALTAGARRETFAALAARWPASAKARLEALPQGGDWFWVDVTAADAPLGPGGMELRTVRVLIPGCIPIAFGPDAIPRGAFGPVSAAARFPHPLA